MTKRSAASFDVLHLLAHLLDQHLQLQRAVGDRLAGRLGGERVGLAVELLARKSRRLPAAPPSRATRSTSARCARSRVELLVDVALAPRTARSRRGCARRRPSRAPRAAARRASPGRRRPPAAPAARPRRRGWRIAATRSRDARGELRALARARGDQLVERAPAQRRPPRRAAAPRRPARSASTPGQRSTSATRSGAGLGKRLAAPRRASARRRASAAGVEALRLRGAPTSLKKKRQSTLPRDDARGDRSRSSGSSARSSSATRNCRSRKREFTERSSRLSAPRGDSARRGGVAGHALDHRDEVAARGGSSGRVS